MTNTRSIILIRHGESLWNLEGKYQGQQDSGLTALGHEQAAQLGAALLDAPRGKIISSDLPRAIDTAAPLAASWGQGIDQMAQLRELDIGSWSGRTFNDVRQSEPETVAAFAAGEDVPRGGGETLRDATTRVVAALDLIANRLDSGERALVFCHGGPIRLASAWVLGLAPTSMHGLEPPANCSATTLTYRDGSWRVRTYNQEIIAEQTRPTDEAAG